MIRMSRVATVAVLLAGPFAASSAAQLVTKQYLTTSPTTDELLARIMALEARVAQLEGLLSYVGGQLVLDGKTAPVVVRGSSVTIQPAGILTLRAGSQLNIGSSASISVRGSGPITLESAGNLDLRGAALLLNGGTKPVACMGGVTSTVEGLRSHFHILTGQGCGNTVLVP